MGLAPAGPRRRDVRGPARPERPRAAGVPPRGRRRGARRGSGVQGRVGRAGRGNRAGPARGHRESGPGDGRHRGRGDRRRGPVGGRHAAVPDRGPRRGLRGAAAEVPVPRPAPARDERGPAPSTPDQPDRARGDGGSGVPRGRDADPDAEHARGCSRLPCPLAPVAGLVLRAPAITAAAEAAPDGGGAGSLLPDRPLSSRRTAARRSKLRVHAARRGDVVRGRGGRLRGHRAAVRAHRPRGARRRGPHPVPALDLRRDDRPLRFGQAGPAVRHGARRSRRRVRGHGFPRVRLRVWTREAS